MKSPLFMPGLICKSSRTLPGTTLLQHEYQFTREANESTARAVIESISDTSALTFFDASHPQLSDPGAYITVAKSGDEFFAMSGNHGWSSAWIPVTQAEIIKYLASCIPDNGPVLPENICTIEPRAFSSRGKIDRNKNANFRKYLNDINKKGA